MKSLIKYTLSLFLFWLFVFFINRLFFVLYQLPIGNRIANNTDLFKAFYKGFQLDFATAVMYLLLPLLFGVLHFIFEKKWLLTTTKIITLVFIILNISTSLGDSGLYREWNAKINVQALEHFKNPKEVFQTVSLKFQLIYFILLIIFSFCFYFIYKKVIHPILNLNSDFTKKRKTIVGISYFLITGGIGFLIIRGGISDVPMNQSVAFFSQDVLANDIAINPFYNLLQDFTIKTNIPDEAVYKFRTNDEAKKLIADDFFVEKDTTISILNNTKPNLVYIILESWSADNISKLGGLEGCTPYFNKLCDEGFLFTKMYSNAYVSDQGVPAVLSSAPSVSRIALVNQPAKVPSISCISEALKPLGYNSSFLFGGELVFGNLKGYLLEKKFDDVRDVNDLDNFPKGRLGVHDEYLFPKLIKIINSKKEPFIQGFFTTSTHMPYDYPTMKNQWQSSKDDVEKKFTEATFYSDYHLGKFIDEAKKQSWYKNTLFILVADHSRNTIKQHDPLDPAHHHIPMLFLGGALKDEFKGKTHDKIVSQLDINSTILHQLNIKSKAFPWSRNSLNPYTKSSAFYIVYGAAGYINDNGYAACSQQSTFIKHPENLDTITVNSLYNKAMSFQQLIYEEEKSKR